MNTRAVNAAAGVIARAMESGYVTPAGWASALESAQLLQSPERAAEFERLLTQIVDLQDAEKQAKGDAARARRERDLIRERVSEPFGCAHCGEAKRVHGRRYISGAGTHTWERPSDEQVKGRMLARRAARSPLPGELELGRAYDDLIGVNLSLYEEELETARLRLALRSAQRGRRVLRARVAELEAERHTSNEALSDAAEALREQRDRIAELEAVTPAPIQTCRKCGAGYDYGRPCSNCEFKAQMAAAAQSEAVS